MPSEAKRNIEDLYPLAPMQEGMLLQSLFSPHGGIYFEHLLWTFEGPLDTAVLKKSWQRVIASHAVLRSCFVWEGLEKPLQVVRRNVETPWCEEDWRGLSAQDQQTKLASLIEEDRRQGFDPAKAPLLRLTLVRLADDRWRSVWAYHHILLDGWSVELVLQDVWACYAAFSQGDEPSLAARRPYRDYIAWLKSQEAAQAEQYWRSTLQDAVQAPPLPLPAPCQAFPPGEKELRAEASFDDTQALKELARSAKTTLNTVLTGAWALLLQRLSGRRDVLFGTVASGRPTDLPGSDAMVGLFINTLPLRVKVEPRLTPLPWLRSLQSHLVEMRRFEYSPLSKVQAWGGAAPGLPLFETLFVFENLPAGEGVRRRLQQVEVHDRAHLETLSGYPLTLIVEPRERLVLILAYDRQRIDSEAAQRLLANLLHLLQSLARRPESRLEELPWLPAEQRRQLLEWGQVCPSESNSSLHQSFQSQAEQVPDAVATMQKEAHLSYSELNQRANRLAHLLRRHALPPETVVACCLPRSLELPVAFWGILKSGCACLPLDPSAPPLRHQAMLECSTAAMLVTGQLSDRSAASHKAGNLFLSTTDWTSPGLPSTPFLLDLAESADDPSIEIDPRQAAFILYTSGSTGRPKGVVLTHGAVAEHCAAMIRLASLHPGQRVLLHHSPAFDAALDQIFPALVSGGCLVQRGEELWPPADFPRLAARLGLGLADLPAAYWHQLVEDLSQRPGAFAATPLGSLQVGGEELLTQAVQAWLQLQNAPLLRNIYGPTEAVIGATVCELSTPPPTGRRVSIGRPLAGHSVWILDAGLKLRPIGIPGEICLGGLLARGYLNSPAQTARSFVPDPFSNLPGARLYRSGDLARLLPDGQIEFLGRIDSQLKIRGYRVEPAEIESALLGHPQVAQAAVRAFGEGAGRRLAAYVVRRTENGKRRTAEDAVREWRGYLAKSLPEYMIPDSFTELDILPETSSGKIDRQALPAPSRPGIERQAEATGETEQRVAQVWKEVLGLTEVGLRQKFFDLGGSSLLLLRLHSRLQKAFDAEIPLPDLFSHPTVADQALLLKRKQPAVLAAPVLQEVTRRARRRSQGEPSGRIAVIGMSCRFPGASDTERFWENLRQGAETIRFFSREELLKAGVHPETADDPAYVPARGVVEGIEMFDAPFFGLNPREASLTDPQQRLFLECAWEALEESGCDPEAFPGRVGVYGGCGHNTYLQRNLLPHRRLVEEAGEFQLAVANEKDFLCTQAAYRLNLRGPSLNVNTACSTSLVAIHLACQNLLHFECDLALAGGVTVVVPQGIGYRHLPGGIASPDGHCRAFDADAQGLVGGNGCGVVALKRLEDALADGDFIHALVCGSAVNNDGSLKVGFTAPARDGQAQVIAEAQAVAGIEPDSIGYVEAHGSGTELGDPVEVDALTRAFRGGTSRRGFCALGSVKSNFGHLDAAAGAAGFIKAVLALRYKMLPPSLHFRRPNPRIDFASSPFFVNARLSPWQTNGLPRRAGVSSFGLGGTNAHVILEEAPARTDSQVQRPWQLLPLSARSPSALDAVQARLLARLRDDPQLSLPEVAYTLQTGRRAFGHRRTLVCRTRDEALQLLERPDDQRVFSARSKPGRPVAFLFSGQGDLYPGLGRHLYETEPVFREEMDRCGSVRSSQFAVRSLESDPGSGILPDSCLLIPDSFPSQAALFAFQYSLAKLWMSWGIRPTAMIGHSLGEYAAACLAGVFSLEEALGLLADRGRMMRQLPRGAMLAVPLPEAQVRGLLEDPLALAAVNGPSLCIVSGPAAAVEGLQQRLKQQQLDCMTLQLDLAGHSSMTGVLAGSFAERVGQIDLKPPQIPFLSGVSGDWISERETCDPLYWSRHLCQTARFGDGLAKLLENPDQVLLEIGPGRSLTSLALQHPDKRESQVALSSLQHPGELGPFRRKSRLPEEAYLLTSLGRLWLEGLPVDWKAFHAHERLHKVPLPTYPFERRRCWIDPPSQMVHQTAQSAIEPTSAPSPEPMEPEPGREIDGPRNETERRLADIWLRFLGIERLGIHDDFFELGGHSLLGTQVLSQVRKIWGLELPLQALFEDPTVAGLASRIQPRVEDSLPAIPRLTNRKELPLSFAQQRLWFLDRLVPGNPFYNIPEAWKLEGPLDVQALQRSLNAIVARHETLRSRFPEVDGAPTVSVVPQYSLPLPLVDLRRLPGSVRDSQARLLAVREARTPIRLAQGPLVRTTLLLLKNRIAGKMPALPAQTDETSASSCLLPPVSCLLLLTLHHIIADGWSMAVLLREMTGGYGGQFAVHRSTDQFAVRSSQFAVGGAEGGQFAVPSSQFAVEGVSVKTPDSDSILRTANCELRTEIPDSDPTLRTANCELRTEIPDSDPTLRTANCELRTLPLQYSDFAAWQNEWMRGEALARQVGYWKEQLAGIQPLELPTDHPRRSNPSFRAGGCSFRLGSEEVAGLRSLSRRQGATLFMTLLAAYHTLLHRLSGQDDIVVGTPIANRSHPQVEPLIGLFVNSLALRLRLHGDPTFEELLRQAAQVCLQAYAHQDLPFEKLVEQLQPERDLTRNPVFQTMLALQSSSVSGARMGEVQVLPFEVEPHAALFDLEAHAAETDTGLAVSLVYDVDLFDTTTIGRVAVQFRNLLQEIAASPEQRISQAARLGAAQRQQLLEWSRPADERARPGRLLHHAFDAQAGSRPHAVAVQKGPEHLSYRQLDRRADLLARRLRRLGCPPETSVGACLPRSPDLLAGLLGTLKAGGVYLPLDPALPRQRVEFLLEDSAARVILTRPGASANLPPFSGASLCMGCLEDLAPAEHPEGSALLLPDQLAYLIYTSGSTGRPKGVEVSHGAAARHCAVWADQTGLTSSDRVLQFASSSFDASIEQIFSTWQAGAVLLLSEDGFRLPQHFTERCRLQGLTAADLPTGYWHQVLSGLQGRPDPFAGSPLRQVMVGGEEMPAEILRLWRGLAGVRPCLLNAYGPTEAVISATLCTLPDEPPAGHAEWRVPIGYPMLGRSAHVLDRYGGLVAAGAPGELCLGGMLARGYRGRPRRTAASFVPDPFSRQSGARLYRSGDRVRHLADGRLEFLGRFDQQVKVRGFRIELGEIESALGRHPGVLQAAAAVRSDAEAGSRLAAYVVLHPSVEASLDELREGLAEQLPDHMVPNWIMVLDELPKMPSGKLDRQALPAPQDAVGRHLPAAPRNPLEARLAGIWVEVLKVEEVGVDDNFFHLGGHSLLATQVLARIELSLGIDLPLRVLFEAPTLTSLAKRVESARPRSPAPPLLPVARTSDLPLSFAQQRLWFLDRMLPGQPFYNIPSAWMLKDTLSAAALEAALTAVVERHEVLRTCFPQRQGRPVQQIAPAVRFPLPLVDLRGLPEELRQTQSRRWSEQLALRPFNLSQGPLLRASLLLLEGQTSAENPDSSCLLPPASCLLLLTLHHIVSDGWSMALLEQELQDGYRTASCEGVEGSGTGRESGLTTDNWQLTTELPPLSIQYADFAVWQTQWLQGDTLERMISYWKGRLEGVSVLRLPTDRPRPSVQTFRGEFEGFRLPTELVDALNKLSRRRGATLFMVLLAAFQALLHRMTGQRDLVVGTPVANRNRPEIERLIGFFVNTLALRAELRAEMGFDELLAQVVEHSVEDFAHQDLPFEKLVETLQPQRDLSRNPVFQVMLALQNAPEAQAGPGGLDMTPHPVPGARTTRFDLEVHLWEEAGGLQGVLTFNLDLFDRTSMARLHRCYGRLLQAFASCCEQPIGDVPLLTQAETHQIVREWNDSSRGSRVPSGEALVHHQAAEWVRRFPDALAAVDGPIHLSYAEWDRRSGALAAQLSGAGAGPESIVGLCIERSVEMVWAAGAIFKAGCAYLPLDPALPAGRVHYMHRESKPVCLLAVHPLPESWEAGDDAWLIQDLQEVPTHIGREVPLHPDNPAYVIYTSGSTGRPKGVVIPHRGLANLVAWHRSTYPAEERENAPLLAATGFDASIWETWAALASGGCLKVVPGPLRSSPRELLDWFEVNAVSSCFLTTALAEALLLDPRRRQHSSVKALRVGGDRLHGQALRNLPAPVHNLYGPTENSILTTGCAVTGPSEVDPPIGRPLPGIEVHLLDQGLQAVPVGVGGHLHISGAGLARGYVNQPALTAERFIPNPVARHPGARLYCSGDLARRLADGQIEFLGRIDDQVKIRGFRIEPGEVESLLGEHPAVRQAAVVVRQEPNGKALAACLTVDGPGPEGLLADLQEHLRRQLPEFMLPTSYLVLDELPFTPNGKLDRKALASMRGTAAPSRSTLLSPRNEFESRIEQIWRELLTGEELGVEDNFFDMGGHSLLMTRLQDRLAESFGRDIPILELFKRPTIEAQAQYFAPRPSGLQKTGDESRSRAQKQKQAVLAARGRRLRSTSADVPGWQGQGQRQGQGQEQGQGQGRKGQVKISTDN